MHHSIIILGAKHAVERCTTCCRLYHCPLCPKFKPTQPSRVKLHLEVHLKNAISFKDKKICRCNLNCRDGGHYHCPVCDKTIIRRKDMGVHLEACQGATQQSAQLPQQSNSSLLRPATTASPSPELTDPPPQQDAVTFAVPSAQLIQTSSIQSSADTHATGFKHDSTTLSSSALDSSSTAMSSSVVPTTQETKSSRVIQNKKSCPNRVGVYYSINYYYY